MTETVDYSIHRAPRISLAYHYRVGVISVTIGIFVVLLLGLFTPLDIIQNSIIEQTGSPVLPSLLGFFLSRIIVLVCIAYGIVMLGLWHLLKPIARCLSRYKKGETPNDRQLNEAQTRLLDLHYLFARMNILIWFIIPALVAATAVLGGLFDYKTAIIFAARASMVGLIVASMATLRIEIVSRKKLIPFFFPSGVLSQMKGVKRRSISQRIMLVNRLGAIVPVIILLVTLLTTQWELEDMSISAAAYGWELIIFTLVLIAWVSGFSWQLSRLQSRNIVDPINELVIRLRSIEEGDYEAKVQVTSNDEVGYAGEVVNTMTEGLKERLTMKHSLDLARQVQQNLLPKSNPVFPGLEIAGLSIYCDETGGDYFDFLELNHERAKKIGIVVGDVSGHGIASALIMATTRGFLRQRCALPGSIYDIVSDVNRQLTGDVAVSGSFMTMFCLFLDTQRRQLEWLRAGHDPAILYDAETNAISELKGDGIALGIDPDYHFQANEKLSIRNGQIILLGTDGIWEARNFSGEMYGKERVYEILKEKSACGANEILNEIIASHAAFRNNLAAEDDITCVIVKVNSLS